MDKAVALGKRARAVVEPLVVRPVGSQAGIGLARVESREELHAYLEEQVYPAYFVMPFVDYRNDDGFFRKYRVMFVDGKPYACHLAISPRWMIHYYNAAMAEHQWMRDEEARFIANLDAVFTGRLRDALDEISAAIPLEYFGIDRTIASSLFPESIAPSTASAGPLTASSHSSPNRLTRWPSSAVIWVSQSCFTHATTWRVGFWS